MICNQDIVYKLIKLTLLTQECFMYIHKIYSIIVSAIDTRTYKCEMKTNNYY